ncbi:unnamed protein product [Caenorhabditis brenneri]
MGSKTLSEDVYEWPDKSFFKKIHTMEPSEFWLHVFGRSGPSKEDEDAFYKRTIEEIKLVGKCIASEGKGFVTKSMSVHISDFISSLTRGLCMFEERYFPIEWRLQGECCEQKKFRKSHPEGKHTMKISTRLFQVSIVCRTTETSLVAKYIPRKLEEDSSTSVFHNVHRFYRLFLESAVDCLCGYKIIWKILEESVESEIEWFKNKYPTKNIDFFGLQQGNEIDIQDGKTAKRHMKRSIEQAAGTTQKMKKRIKMEKSNFTFRVIKTEVDDDTNFPSFNMIESQLKSPSPTLRAEELRDSTHSDSIESGVTEDQLKSTNIMLSTDDCSDFPSSSNAHKLNSPSSAQEDKEHVSYLNSTMNPLTVTIPKTSSIIYPENRRKKVEESDICLAPISSDSARSSCSTSTDPCLVTVYEESAKVSPVDQLISMPTSHEELVEDSTISSGDELEGLCEQKNLNEKQNAADNVCCSSEIPLASPNVSMPIELQTLTVGETQRNFDKNQTQRVDCSSFPFFYIDLYTKFLIPMAIPF